MPTYPASPFPKPNQSFGFSDDNQVTRTEMASGLPRQEPRFNTSVRTFSIELDLSESQFADFETWYNDELNKGTLFFDVSIPTTGGSFEDLSVRFLGKYNARYKPVDRIVVSATWEQEQVQSVPTPQPPLIPVWYQPSVSVTDNITIDGDENNKLLVVTPTGGETIVVLQDTSLDLTGQTIGLKLTAPGSVLLTNIGVNEPPVSKTVLVEGFEGTGIPGDGSTTDPNSDTITYSAGSVAPDNGTLTSVDPVTGAFVYTPDAFYTGIDQFTITATDSGGLSGTVTVIMFIKESPDTWQEIAVNYFGAWGVYIPGAVGGVNTDIFAKVEWLNDFSGNGHNLQDSNVTTGRRATLATVSGKTYLRAFHNGSNSGQCFNGSHASFGSPAFDTWAIGAVVRANTAGSANGTNSMIGVSSTTSTTAAVSKNETGNWNFGFNGSLSGGIAAPNPFTSGAPHRVSLQVLEDNVRSVATVGGKTYAMFNGTSAPLANVNLGTATNNKVTFSNYDFGALVILDPTGVALLDTSEGRARWDEMMDKMAADFA